ncbi:hypothetical protein [Krasilnikovia sp. MM14-A1259]|uniref:hypothetical protein n=1 Tax=Krasilnikovia sp. MM14-A1259 TaxID=3373539 RepID=UPI0037F57B99
MKAEPLARLRAWVEGLVPNDRYLQAGRSVIAAAQICSLLFITDDVAFTAAERAAGPCASPWSAIWCSDSRITGGTIVARALSLIVLAAVMMGFKPRWTCIPHFLVSLSMAMAFTVNTGGERVATIITALVIPVCVSDGRSWAWIAGPHSGDRRSPSAGSAAAAVLTIRAQLSIVYLVAAVSKTVTPGWGTGGWLQSVFLDPTFGLPPIVLTPMLPVIENRVVMVVLEVAVVVGELIIAAGVCGNRTLRSVALLVGLGLHASIGLLMGLPAFGAIMVGGLLVARGGCRPPTHARELPDPDADAVLDHPGSLPRMTT